MYSVVFNLLCKWRQWKRLNGERSFWSTSRPSRFLPGVLTQISLLQHHTTRWLQKQICEVEFFHQIELLVMKNMPVKSLGIFIIGEKYL